MYKAALVAVAATARSHIARKTILAYNFCQPVTASAETSVSRCEAQRGQSQNRWGRD